MKIKTKLPLFTSITVLLSIAFIAIFSIVSFRNRTIENIENYKVEELTKVKKQLKDIVNIAYDMINQSYENSSAKAIKETYGIDVNNTQDINVRALMFRIMNITLENLRVLRYGVNGYIWINEIDPPYIVKMHATNSSLEEKGWVFKIPGTEINVYEEFADICNESGEGFLEYSFPKPGQTVQLPKMSFIKLFKPLGWVIGTGVYIDNIETEVQKKTGELEQQINRLVWITIIIGIFLVALASTFLYFLGNNVTNAIGEVNNQLLAMAKGHGVEKVDSERKDEIGEMNVSLNTLIDGVSSYTDFANEIGKGNLNAKFAALSSGDQLGNSLIEMRQSLKTAREEEKIRQQENRIRNWGTEGQSLISDVIKGTGDDLKIISHKIISTLVKYLDANQGGLFLMNDDNPKDVYIELMASFAYSRSRFHKKRLEYNEGLIGACFLEKKPIYITKIPKDYMEIRSGLGTANPKNLLIVPLKIEERVIGIIELASFKELKKYEIEFIENISENISSILFTSRTSKQTKDLLEKFRKQADEKASQDEEMKNKIKELEMLRDKLKLEEHYQN